MRKIYLLIFFLFSFFTITDGQNSSDALYLEGGFSYGLFFPREVNDFILADLPSGTMIKSGTSDIFMNFTAIGGLTYFMQKNIAIRGMGTISLAPKVIYINGYSDENSYSYMMWKISPGAMVTYYFPLLNEIKFGPGVGISGNIIGFNGQSSFSIGGRGQLELLYLGSESLNLTCHMGFEYAKGYVSKSPKELDFSSFLFGVTLWYRLD